MSFRANPALLGAKHSGRKLRGLNAGVETTDWSVTVTAPVVLWFSVTILSKRTSLWYLILLTVY